MAFDESYEALLRTKSACTYVRKRIAKCRGPASNVLSIHVSSSVGDMGCGKIAFDSSLTDRFEVVKFVVVRILEVATLELGDQKKVPQNHILWSSGSFRKFPFRFKHFPRASISG